MLDNDNDNVINIKDIQHENSIDVNARFLEKRRLQDRALQLFNIIVAEFESDPLSVQCFDLRIVNESKEINAKLRKL